MTTIAFDGVNMAADRLAMRNGYMSKSNGKLNRCNEGVIGYAGDVGICKEYVEWMVSGRSGKPPALRREDGEYGVVLFAPYRGPLELHTHGCIEKLKEKRWAIGSGRGIALGAMAAGASARLAVLIASKFDECTGGGVQVLGVR